MASYDLLIIGAGPAAWSCAMTARQRGLTTAVACAQSATSWLQRAERIDNYPGLPQISGKELLSRFRAQAADMGVIIIEQLARQIMPSGDIYMTLVGNDIIESRAIVLAMGAARPKLLPGLKTEGAFIPVDRRMATNLPRVYACGDCTGQPLQIAKAVGEGNVAAISASADLSKGARA